MDKRIDLLYENDVKGFGVNNDPLNRVTAKTHQTSFVWLTIGFNIALLTSTVRNLS